MLSVPIAAFTDTWWWNLLSIAISVWAGVRYAEYRQRRIGLGAVAADRVRESIATGPAPRAADPDVPAPLAHSLEQIGLDRRSWRAARKPSAKRTTPKDGQGAVSGEDAVPLMVGGLVATALLASAYLYARPWAQALIVGLAAAALGFVVGTVRGLRRRGDLENQWKALLFAGGVVAAAAFGVVWLLRNPRVAGDDGAFLLAVLDADGPRAVTEAGGWMGRFFFAAQGLAVLLAILAVIVLVKHFLGPVLEVNHRLKLPSSRAGRIMLRFERRFGFGPWGGVAYAAFRSHVRTGPRLRRDNGSTEPPEPRFSGGQRRSDRHVYTSDPRFWMRVSTESRDLTLGLFVSEPVGLRLRVLAGERRRRRRVANVPRRLRPVETALTLNRPGGRPWPSGAYLVSVTVTDLAGNRTLRRKEVTIKR